jgi:hypothetical protein
LDLEKQIRYVTTISIKEKMITTRIKALFQFIDFLHSNIDNFNLNNGLIKELELLDNERQKVSSKKTFKDKLKYDEVQAEIKTKFKILQGNTANLIKAKAKELNVCNFDNEPNYSFNGIETDIHQLTENFSKDDLPEIFKHKQQYIEYRTQTHQTFLSLAFFIDELDEITKSLFDYFKKTEKNEFEAFETKAIQVNDLSEAVELMSIGKKKFSVPINSKQPRNKPQFATHEKLFEAVIFSANEEQNKPIAGAYELLKEVWFFLNSDSATFNGKDVEKYKRPLFVNPVIVGKPEFDEFFEAEITYCSTQNKIGLKELDFVTDISNWIEKKSKDKSLSIPRKRKFNEFLEYTKTKALPPQPIVESPFSVLEWATIFYYADETKLLTESRLIKTRLEQFMSKHQINTTPVNFKNSYYEAKRRINEKNDYPINKLELIIPFLKENYKQTVTKVENDIIFLEENKPEY